MMSLNLDIILVEILPRLPVKSLFRFKCVSKSFRAAILSRSLLILPGVNRVICYNLNSLATASAATFTWDDSCSVSVVGSCNGLLCIFARSSVHYLSILNPLTRVCKYIPISIHTGLAFNLGFAFDHNNLDYKIVVVSEDPLSDAIKTRVTKVYSIKTTSWTIIETALPTDSMEERHGGVLIHNHLLHWMFWSPSLRKHRIGCFDVCKNNWIDDVLLPDYYYSPTHKNYLLDLGVFDDGLFSLFENQIDSSFDVWVMKEYGVQDSWIKYLSIPISNDLSSGVVPVICRDESSQVLIRQRHTSRLFWYNGTDGEMSKARFLGSPGFSNLQVYTCSRSVADLPGGELFRDS